MKVTTALIPALLAFGAAAQTIRNPARKAKYDSGEVHQQIMDAKEATWARRKAAGAFDSTQYATITEPIPCVDGRAGEFRCSNVDLLSFYSHADLGSATGEGSSSWGWTTDTGREIIIIAQADGAAFAEVTLDGKLDYLGRLPQSSTADPIIWREIRLWNNFAIIGSEAVNHHIQIFDLNKVAAITDAEKPKTFNPDTDVTGMFKGLPVGRTHNVVTNTDSNYFVSVGSQPRNSTFRSGLVFVSLEDPSNPKLLGFNGNDGYVHDAQCLAYKGPDQNFQGADICYGYDEDTLTIFDVTDKANSSIISRTSYVGASFTHQGWVTDRNNQSFILLDDEFDEIDEQGPGADGHPVTFIWDITNLSAPVQTGFYKSAARGIDHNQYVWGNRVFQSNYGTGLRILDISSIPSDPTGAGVKEVAFFDIFPEDDTEPGGGTVDFLGTWSAYAGFASKNIVINTIERGAFVVRYTNW
jgi:choice-of-anchor B domain-containing protein